MEKNTFEETLLMIIVLLFFVFLLVYKKKESFDASKDSLTVIANNGDNIIVSDGKTKKKVSKVCTHMGCILDLSGNKLLCPCHGSEFSLDGKVLVGPARDNLEVTSLNEQYKNYNRIKALEW
jgi:Rieske Fe-S protein